MSGETTLVAVRYNRDLYLGDYLAAVHKHHQDTQLIVVDVAPKTPPVVPTNIPYRRICPGKASYSKAINVALIEVKTEYVVWGNDDFIVNGPFVDTMIDKLKSEPRSLVGPVVFDRYVEGCMVAMRIDTVDEVGFLDERFPGCFEDVDYSRRATRLGYKLIKVKIPVIHADLGQLDKHAGYSHQLYKEKWIQ